MRFGYNNNINISKNISKTWINKNVELIKKILYDNKGIKFLRRWFKKRVDFRNR